jgi:hypothetical protein
MFSPDIKNFQTPPEICNFMASMVPYKNSRGIISHVLEPTPGKKQLVNSLLVKGYRVSYPDGDFWEMKHLVEKYDAVVMNPPFTPMRLGIRFLKRAMLLSDHIICLFPYLLLANSQQRQIEYQQWGMRKLITLPRDAFPGSRVQCCIMVLDKEFSGQTTFEYFTY